MAERACVDLGAALRAVREQQGMPQVDLSDASGLHRTHISRTERGLCDPRYDTLMKLRRGPGSLAEVFALTEGAYSRIAPRPRAPSPRPRPTRLEQRRPSGAEKQDTALRAEPVPASVQSPQ
jgi:transcriptional regulator with XRE-family HTH domain